MRTILTVSTIITFFLMYPTTFIAARKGIVIVPVADLVGEPIMTHYTTRSIANAYIQLPWAHYKNDYAACPRVHQLLYHELVDIIGKRNNEVLIRIPNVFYQTYATNQPQTYYWTLEQNILPLPKRSIDLTKVPPSIQFKTKSEQPLSGTVTLIEPFTDPSFGITFSAGTRFVPLKEQPDKNNVIVYCVHPTTHTMTTLTIPTPSVYVFTPKTMQERMGDFLTILRRWTQNNNGIIPYVWGGCSFTDRHANNEFTMTKDRMKGKLLGYYTRPAAAVPRTGFDCSSIIVRAAQMVGLPYYFKNTYTIGQQLPSLGRQDPLREGDLILIRGHVLIAANSTTNTVIEACAYDYGYGEVHEIPIGKVFKGVDTFAELQKRYRDKKPVERLHRNGTVLDTYKEVTLLKFASQWI